MISIFTQQLNENRFFAPSVRIALIIIFSILLLFLPSVKYILPFVILTCYVFFIFRKSGNDARFLAKWFLIALSVRLVYLCLVQFVPAIYHETPFFFLDDKSYHLWSVNISERWHQGERPRIWTDSEIGTLQTGYYYFISGVYYILGKSPYIPLLLNPLLGALICILIYRFAHIALNEKAQRKAVILTALNPVFWYWSCFILKDTLLTLFFVFTLVLYLEFKNTKNWLYLYFFFVVSCFLAILRVPSFMVIILTILLYEFINSTKKTAVLLICLAGILFAIIGRRFILVKDIEDQILYSFLNALPDSGKTFPGTLKYIIKGIPRFFLAPYGWVIADYFTPEYFLYPGQWFLYLFLLPYAISGAIQMVRDNKTICLFILFPIILKGYLYLIVLSGSAQRHLVELMPLLILMAVYGLRKALSQRFMILYFGAFVSFMLVQFLSIVIGK
jgi:hypothetical protein